MSCVSAASRTASCDPGAIRSNQSSAHTRWSLLYGYFSTTHLRAASTRLDSVMHHRSESGYGTTLQEQELTPAERPFDILRASQKRLDAEPSGPQVVELFDAEDSFASFFLRKLDVPCPPVVDVMQHRDRLHRDELVHHSATLPV